MKFFQASSISIPRSSFSVFWALVGLAAFLLALYTYFITASVVYVVVRAEVSQDIVSVHSRISELESEYLTKTEMLTAAYAQAEGFTQVSAKTFAARDTALAAGFAFEGTGR